MKLLHLCAPCAFGRHRWCLGEASACTCTHPPGVVIVVWHADEYDDDGEAD